MKYKILWEEWNEEDYVDYGDRFDTEEEAEEFAWNHNSKMRLACGSRAVRKFKIEEDEE